MFEESKEAENEKKKKELTIDKTINLFIFYLRLIFLKIIKNDFKDYQIISMEQEKEDKIKKYFDDKNKDLLIGRKEMRNAIKELKIQMNQILTVYDILDDDINEKNNKYFDNDDKYFEVVDKEFKNQKEEDNGSGEDDNNVDENKSENGDISDNDNGNSDESDKDNNSNNEDEQSGDENDDEDN